MKKNEIKILLNSKNIKEIRENIPLELPELFLFFPAFVFILTPFFQLVKRLLLLARQMSPVFQLRRNVIQKILFGASFVVYL